MMRETLEFFKLLSDETRFRVIMLLLEKELAVCELVGILDLPQPKVSKALAKLRDLGLVLDERKEKYMYYSLNPETFAKVQAFAAENAQLREIEHVYTQSNNALK